MIVPVDLRNVVPPEVLAMLSEDAVLAIIKDLADAARSEWDRLAGKELGGSAPDYKKAIQEVKFGRMTATVTLLGEQANRLEQGHERIEQKKGLLGPKVPVTKPPNKGKRQRYTWERRNGKKVAVEDGYYRPIPFRHATPGTRGQVGSPMGDAYRNLLGPGAAKRLGRAVYEAAKQLAPTTTQPYGAKTEWGERLDTENIVYGKKQQKIDVPKLKERHTVSIYAGMYRMEKMYEKKTQGYYQTFRMIAVDKSGQLVNGRDKKTGRGLPKDPDSWVIPAKKGIHLAEKVAKYIQQIAPASFQAYAEGMK